MYTLHTSYNIFLTKWQLDPTQQYLHITLQTPCLLYTDGIQTSRATEQYQLNRTHRLGPFQVSESTPGAQLTS
jgi:hypothetical protein